MKKIITLLIAFVCVVSCKEETKSEKKTISTETTVKEKSVVVSEKVIEIPVDKEQLLSTSIAYFKNCKENASTRNDCRNSITKMISEFYSIPDFKNAQGDYVIYDSIQPIISSSSDWVKLGKASKQKVLTKAQEAANSGKATIAIDMSETYGQVAMIIPGSLTNSGTWNLKVPNTAALVNYDEKKSFVNKPLSYAFRSTENIVLFSKK